MADIVEILKEKLNLPEERLLELIAIGKERTISRNNRFIAAGTIPRKFGFVVSGLFRYVYSDENGQEFTKGIISEFSFY
jgi:CRP-like cAMP-binding protein